MIFSVCMEPKLSLVSGYKLHTIQLWNYNSLLTLSPETQYTGATSSAIPITRQILNLHRNSWDSAPVKHIINSVIWCEMWYVVV